MDSLLLQRCVKQKKKYFKTCSLTFAVFPAYNTRGSIHWDGPPYDILKGLHQPSLEFKAVSN